MAFGSTTVSLASGAASDLLSVEGHHLKADASRLSAKGYRIEAERYGEAAKFADLNAHYTEISTAIKTQQMDRAISKTLGSIQSDYASSGLAAKGSSVDVLRDSTQAAALSRATLQMQGLITEQGYQEQAKAYRLQADAANVAAAAADKGAEAEDSAGDAAMWTGALKGAGAVASVFMPGV
jgi:hypothetical protein